MARVVIGRYREDEERPLLARPLASAVTTDGATWAEVTQIVGGAANSFLPAIPNEGASIDVFSTVALNVMITLPTVALLPGDPEQGYYLPGGQPMTLYMRSGERLWLRTAT